MKSLHTRRNKIINITAQQKWVNNSEVISEHLDTCCFVCDYHHPGSAVFEGKESADVCTLQIR